ncbi:peptidylprolyl isomerase [Sporosarcina limicola]|uniref:Peptidyl-prolyl cis-trans isomerase n=1 Tax=Sporosarcina limicola TaxID=34101 RepID=A0A927MEA0_9BACL|nr:peptidylprolyl isomerase [Sporosarcina limicola]MBE1552965.1 peptidyl-prolyl cis-trans isomerase B (cyclophilin B) [Sporosarcina limicola]
MDQNKLSKNPIAIIVMSNGCEIRVELFPEIAPNTVKNFIDLATKGFFNNLTFHRTIAGFMIQGGDPLASCEGGPGYTIAGEFSENGHANDMKHIEGVISMARTEDPNSAGSQFFIMHKPTARLDGKYAAFGKVIEGYEEVDRIANVKTDGKDKPLEIQQMVKVTVELFGNSYDKPVISVVE